MNSFDCVSAYFDSTQSQLFEVYVLISDGLVSHAVFNRRENTFLVLKAKPLADPEDFRSYVNYELNYPFNKVKILLVNPYNTFFPATLFDKNRITDSFSFNQPFNPATEELLTDPIHTAGLINIFKVSKLLHDLINSYFQNYTLSHYSTSFIEGLMADADHHEELHLFLSDDFFHIIYRKQREIKFVNSFEFETHEDILYYILAVYEQLQLNLRSLPLSVHGNSGRFVELFSMLRKYIYEVNLAARPVNFLYDPALDSIPEHLFFTLFSAPLCV